MSLHTVAHANLVAIIMAKMHSILHETHMMNDFSDAWNEKEQIWKVSECVHIPLTTTREILPV